MTESTESNHSDAQKQTKTLKQQIRTTSAKMRMKTLSLQAVVSLSIRHLFHDGTRTLESRAPPTCNEIVCTSVEGVDSFRLSRHMCENPPTYVSGLVTRHCQRRNLEAAGGQREQDEGQCTECSFTASRFCSDSHRWARKRGSRMTARASSMENIGLCGPRTNVRSMVAQTKVPVPIHLQHETKDTGEEGANPETVQTTWKQKVRPRSHGATHKERRETTDGAHGNGSKKRRKAEQVSTRPNPLTGRRPHELDSPKTQMARETNSLALQQLAYGTPSVRKNNCSTSPAFGCASHLFTLSLSPYFSLTLS